jgi:hypothetical protein
MAIEHSVIYSSGQPVIVTINRLAWHEGMQRAREGGSSFDNPYPLGSAEAYSWLSGFIGCDDQIRQADDSPEAGTPFMGQSSI